MTQYFDYPLSEGDHQSEGSSVPIASMVVMTCNRTFLEVASMAVTWWIVTFLVQRHNLFTNSVLIYFAFHVLVHPPHIMFSLH